MSEFTMEAILDMQRRLQERYHNVWEPICPENGKSKLLWMLGETGEVIDIIKKRGHDRIMNDPEVRGALVEELADVLMYYGDVMLCYDIRAEELSQAYTAKFERNMKRWNVDTGEMEG